MRRYVKDTATGLRFITCNSRELAERIALALNILNGWRVRYVVEHVESDHTRMEER